MIRYSGTLPYRAPFYYGHLVLTVKVQSVTFQFKELLQYDRPVNAGRFFGRLVTILFGFHCTRSITGHRLKKLTPICEFTFHTLTISVNLCTCFAITPCVLLLCKTDFRNVQGFEVMVMFLFFLLCRKSRK